MVFDPPLSTQVGHWPQSRKLGICPSYGSWALAPITEVGHGPNHGSWALAPVTEVGHWPQSRKLGMAPITVVGHWPQLLKFGHLPQLLKLGMAPITVVGHWPQLSLAPVTVSIDKKHNNQSCEPTQVYRPSQLSWDYVYRTHITTLMSVCQPF